MGNNLKNQHYKNMGIMLQMDTLTFEAESTAFVVCLRLGVDTSSYSFSYLKSWLKEPDELKEIADCVQKISYEIINGLAGSSDLAFLNLKEESEEYCILEACIYRQIR